MYLFVKPHQDEVEKIVPGARYITILREPLSAFESNYVYMGFQKAKNATLNGR